MTADKPSDPPSRSAKIVIAGLDNAGKTELISALLKEVADRYGQTATSETFPTVSLTINEEPLLLGFWEYSENGYNRLRPLIYPMADMVLFCIPLDRINDYTFEILQRRVEGARYCMEEFISSKGWRTQARLYVIGCRSDLVQPGSSSTSMLLQEASAFMAEHEMHGYSECSAVTGDGIPGVLDLILEAIFSPPLTLRRKRRRRCTIF